jgi:CRP-like cAMP-binding protein
MLFFVAKYITTFLSSKLVIFHEKAKRKQYFFTKSNQFISIVKNIIKSMYLFNYFMYFCTIKVKKKSGMTISANQEKDKIVQEMASLWDVLSSEQAELLKANLSIGYYKKNETIYKEADDPVNVFSLIHGKIKITKDGISGRNQIVRTVKPLELFGYRAYFAHQNYHTSAIAFEPCTIVFFPISVFTQILKENTDFCFYIISHLATELGQADDRTVNLTQKHIRGRLAEALITLKDKYGLEEDGYTLSIYLSRDDLASMSNMTTSNAIRTLSSFANEHLIAIDGRKIKILEEDELRRVSTLG